MKENIEIWNVKFICSFRQKIDITAEYNNIINNNNNNNIFL